MKGKLRIWIIVTAICLLAALPAMAANVFSFTEKSITLFEGEMAETALNQDGAYAEGEIVYSSEKTKIATVSEDGVVTAVSKGKTRIIADLMQNGKRARRVYLEVVVARRVTEVTLNRKNLTVLEPEDPQLAELLAPLPEGAEPRTDPVLILQAGKTVNLSATCMPEDASNRKVTFTSSDEGIAKIQNGTKIRAMEKGECDLVVASAQNPEIQEIYHVLVIEPVKKIQIQATDKTVFAGEQMKLTAVCTPETADIQKVAWKSRRPAVATVDENGLVTGLVKGEATIEAKATDGTEVVGTLTIRVAQNVTEVTLKQEELTIATGKKAALAATVLPKDANNKKLIWSSSDETVAVVGKDGRVTGKKAGICVITCVSESNPLVSASAVVQVIQPVTRITFSQTGALTFPIRTSQQLSWKVEPYDATNQAVTFKSNHPEIAMVDGNGLVTGIKRGEATITATAADGSKRTASIKVVVTQPVEGVLLPQQTYYIQRGRETTVRATVLPKDANNQKVNWVTGDEQMATVRSSGSSTGRVTGGYWNGTTTITAITEDGGYTATAELKVADYDAAILVEGLEITEENKIRIILRNTGDFPVERVFMQVDCYDIMGNPMVYNTDGATTGFEAVYPLTLQSGERSIHGQFRFNDYLETGLLGQVVVTVKGYWFENGQQWEIPEEYRIPTLPARSIYYGTATPTPMPPVNPETDGENPNG